MVQECQLEAGLNLAAQSASLGAWLRALSSGHIAFQDRLIDSMGRSAESHIPIRLIGTWRRTRDQGRVAGEYRKDHQRAEGESAGPVWSRLGKKAGDWYVWFSRPEQRSNSEGSMAPRARLALATFGYQLRRLIFLLNPMVR
jgi:hypothetical protein